MTSSEAASGGRAPARARAQSTLSRALDQRGQRPGPERSNPARMAAALALVTLIGIIDFLTGVELRVYPLYFVPIALSAWNGRTPEAVILALASVVAWMGSNHFSGLHYSHVAIWVFNAIAQTVAFLTVGLLIAASRRHLRRERELARSDALTGLPNTRAFFEHAEVLLAQAHRHDRSFALAYVDLDDFKKVNDGLGHEGGDQVLRLVGDVLATSLRKTDLAARIGGDEFVVFLPETDFEAARGALERVRETLRVQTKAPEWTANGMLRISVSIGAVWFQKAPPSLSSAISRADSLMYEVKRRGKDQVMIESSESLDLSKG